MFANSDEIKTRLTPEAVLRLIGYEKSNPKKMGNQWRDACPVHGGKEHNLAIAEDGKWMCHSKNCKGGDLISLYMQAKRVDFKTAISELGSYLGISTDHSSSPSKQKEENRLEKSRRITAKIWEKSADSGDDSYFRKKGIDPVPGVRYGEHEGQCILVPYYDIDNNLQSIQRIKAEGSKKFVYETTPEAAFFRLGDIKASNFVYLCEGIATAASVWLSEKKAIPTLSCGGVGNIPKVVKALKQKYSQLEMVICLDDDHTAEKTIQEIESFGAPGISFRKPDFTGLQRRQEEKEGIVKFLDKDFNDLHKLVGLEKVREQLLRRVIPEGIATIGLVSEENLIRYYRDLPPGIDIGLKQFDEALVLPAGGYTVFAAPTKHGKTQALVNVVYEALQKDQTLNAIFMSFEEQAEPVLLRFMNRHIEIPLSKNNKECLSYFYKNFGIANEEARMFQRGVDVDLFHKNRTHFERDFLRNGRLRIVDESEEEGKLSSIDHLCARLEAIRKYIPAIRLVAIDYIQYLTVERPGKRAREEILKEVCRKLHAVAAKTGLVVVTAAQFNRTIQNEDDLHFSAIGEGGSIERQASLVFGMWNRNFPQFEGGKKMDKRMEPTILLFTMLSRHGPAQQRLIVPGDLNIGKINFKEAWLSGENMSPLKSAEGPVRPHRKWEGDR